MLQAEGDLVTYYCPLEVITLCRRPTYSFFVDVCLCVCGACMAACSGQPGDDPKWGSFKCSSQTPSGAACYANCSYGPLDGPYPRATCTAGRWGFIEGSCNSPPSGSGGGSDSGGSTTQPPPDEVHQLTSFSFAVFFRGSCTDVTGRLLQNGIIGDLASYAVSGEIAVVPEDCVTPGQVRLLAWHCAAVTAKWSKSRESANIAMPTAHFVQQRSKFEHIQHTMRTCLVLA